MAIKVNAGLDVKAPQPSDKRYGPWQSVSEALAGIPQSYRYKGMPVYIDGKEYIFNNGIGDSDLISSIETYQAEVWLPTEVTYKELKNLLDNSQLIPGKRYTITDFQTIHIIRESSDINIGPVEKLTVTAQAPDTLFPQAYSEEFPEDIIYYDLETADWEALFVTTETTYSSRSESYVDGSNGPTANGEIPSDSPKTKGTITYREDTKNDIRVYYDWRAIRHRRFYGTIPEITFIANRSKPIAVRDNQLLSNQDGARIQVTTDGTYDDLLLFFDKRDPNSQPDDYAAKGVFISKRPKPTTPYPNMVFLGDSEYRKSWEKIGAIENVNFNYFTDDNTFMFVLMADFEYNNYCINNICHLYGNFQCQFDWFNDNIVDAMNFRKIRGKLINCIFGQFAFVDDVKFDLNECRFLRTPMGTTYHHQLENGVQARRWGWEVRSIANSDFEGFRGLTMIIPYDAPLIGIELKGKWGAWEGIDGNGGNQPGTDHYGTIDIGTNSIDAENSFLDFSYSNNVVVHEGVYSNFSFTKTLTANKLELNYAEKALFGEITVNGGGTLSSFLNGPEHEFKIIAGDQSLTIENDDVNYGVDISTVAESNSITLQSGQYAIFKFYQETLRFQVVSLSFKLSDPAAVEEVSYAGLIDKVNNSELIPNKKYRIIDYQTIHVIRETSDINIGPVEPLVVTAQSSDILYPQAYSGDFPQDIIYYDPSTADWEAQYVTIETDYSPASEDYVDGFNGPTIDGAIPSGSAKTKGTITYRKDTTSGVETYFDWRAIRHRRFNGSIPEIAFRNNRVEPIAWKENQETAVQDENPIVVSTDGTYEDVLTFFRSRTPELEQGIRISSVFIAKTYDRRLVYPNVVFYDNKGIIFVRFVWGSIDNVSFNEFLDRCTFFTLSFGDNQFYSSIYNNILSFIYSYENKFDKISDTILDCQEFIANNGEIESTVIGHLSRVLESGLNLSKVRLLRAPLNTGWYPDLLWGYENQDYQGCELKGIRGLTMIKPAGMSMQSSRIVGSYSVVTGDNQGLKIDNPNHAGTIEYGDGSGTANPNYILSSRRAIQGVFSDYPATMEIDVNTISLNNAEKALYGVITIDGGGTLSTITNGPDHPFSIIAGDSPITINSGNSTNQVNLMGSIGRETLTVETGESITLKYDENQVAYSVEKLSFVLPSPSGTKAQLEASPAIYSKSEVIIEYDDTNPDLIRGLKVADGTSDYLGLPYLLNFNEGSEEYLEFTKVSDFVYEATINRKCRLLVLDFIIEAVPGTTDTIGRFRCVDTGDKTTSYDVEKAGQMDVDPFTVTFNPDSTVVAVSISENATVIGKISYLI